ncbi:amyloid-beta-like protein [Onthophagus taurus]|uniref:amyloid-beta-like protein n=1 Tax=Onthophagus taurus TaxID=166361 RepID=UPI000C1FFA1F|nr:amyloid-beta-like protein [Onthophagus taurus]
MNRIPAVLGILLVATSPSVTGLQDGISGGPVSHFEPQVAILCDAGIHGQEAYHPQYMAEQGKWTTDLTSKATCLKDKMDILDYCKKMYPKRDITNIVESSHYLKIGSWCRVGSTSGSQSRGKCKTARWVKPFRCLEGPFQSDALLVPENCLFDHIHNQSNCWTFGRWNTTAANACVERGLQLRSFAMLLPCGISLFSGVEFVCCPKHFKDNLKPKKPVDLTLLKSDAEIMDTEDDDDSSDEEDDKDDLDDLADETELSDAPNPEDEEEDDDDYDDEDEDWDTTSTSTAATVKPTPAPTTTTTTMKTTSVPTPDPYFTHFDPRNEHQSYKEAQERLEETHREKVTRVMKDWSDLEERYQDMRATDPRGADAFKQRMTLRFQQTVQALEEEGDAEKHQLAAMHQQRVLAHINQRKKEAMGCYTQALNDQPPNVHRVQKCLQKLLRALHKDRAHTITHYRHLLASSLEAAAREQPRTLERLTDIDKTVNQSMQMLKRYPELSTKISQLMDDYIQALRSKDDTPGSLLAMTTEAEAAILDKYKTEVVSKQAERERQRQQEKERKEMRKKERTELREEKKRVENALGKKISNFDSEDMEDESIIPAEDKTTISSTSSENVVSEVVSNAITTPEENRREVDDAAVQQAVEEVAAVPHQQDVIRIAHSMTHEISHGEPTYSVHREVYGRKDSKSVYFTLAFAGMALMAAIVVGVAVAKRRSSRSPQSQGFIEVDQAATPEERHVANMQINGYENPTYKYFEVKE